MAASAPVLPTGKRQGDKEKWVSCRGTQGDTACETRKDLNEDKDIGRLQDTQGQAVNPE